MTYQNMTVTRNIFMVIFCLIGFSNVWSQDGWEISDTEHDEYERSNQSKTVWFAGDWYGILPVSNSGWTLKKYNDGDWDSLQLLESSSTRTPDMVVDPFNQKLYILFPYAAKIYRFTYKNNNWDLDSEFPLAVGGMEDVSKTTGPSLALANDGDLFISYMHGDEIRIIHSVDGGETWNGSPYVIGTSGSSVGGLTDAIAFYYNGESYMGVFAAENSSQDNRFFKLKDADDPSNMSNWDEESMPGSASSDDHVAITRDFAGNLYAIVKRGTGGGSVFLLYHRDTSGSWHDYDVDASSGSRPAICVDEDNNQLYIFAMVSDEIHYAVTDLGSPSGISSGDWTTFISDGSDSFNNVSCSYQPLGAATGIIATAVNMSSSTIWYNIESMSYSFDDDIIISEVNSRNPVEASYVEILNTGNSSIDLSDYTLEYFDDGSSSATAEESLSGTIEPGEFFVLARNQSSFLSAYGKMPEFENSGFLLNGGADGIGLYRQSSRADQLIDRFNDVDGSLEVWTANELFNRNEQDNSGRNIYADYFPTGRDEPGSPGVGNDQSLPVTLVFFEANLSGNSVEISWQTASEIENHIFQLYRSGPYNGPFRLIETVAGNGNSNTGHFYGVTDSDVQPGQAYFYKLVSRDFDGRVHEYDSEISVTVPLAAGFELVQNYPNPFNSETTIMFGLNQAEHVTLNIFNIRGELVSSLVDDYYQPGKHKVAWTGTGTNGFPLPSGLYLCQVKTESRQQTLKMILSK